MLLFVILTFVSVGAYHRNKIIADIVTSMTTVLHPIVNDHQKQSVSPLKIIKYCGKKLSDCVLSSDCRRTLQCFQQCPPSDVNCTNNCFFQYSNVAFNTLAKCMIENKCLPQLNFSDHSCPYGGMIPNHKTGLINRIFLGRENIGRYYVARGWNRGYDCANCQKLEYVGIEGSDPIRLATHWSSEVDGVLKTANNTLLQDSSNTMMTKYSLFGMDVEEHYYLLDWEDDGSWVMFYYCGYGFGSEYQGALLLSRKSEFDEIPTFIEKKFDESISDAGLEDYLGPISSWCQPIFTTECKKFKI